MNLNGKTEGTLSERRKRGVNDVGKWKKVSIRLLLMTVLVLVGSLSVRLNVEAKSGSWQQNSSGWWFRYSDGTYPKSQWLQIQGKWYYFQSNGYMKTGWLQLKGKWYFFNSQGVMQKGWRQISRKWYYFNSKGVMQTGWNQISRKWYFFNSSGVMQTGWRQISRKWYFFNSQGVMQTGWKQISGKWYFLNSDGVMATGWKIISGYWYYFDKNGVMFTGKHTINGVVNEFDSSGKWVDPNTKWAEAYIDYLQHSDFIAEYGYYDIEYRFLYIDSDDIPEIHCDLSGWGLGPGSLVISYQNGKVFEQQVATEDGYLSYAERGGALAGDHGRQGCYGQEVYKLSSDGFKLVGYDNYGYDYMDWENETHDCYWNGKSVSLSTYESKKKGYSGGKEWKVAIDDKSSGNYTWLMNQLKVK